MAAGPLETGDRKKVVVAKPERNLLGQSGTLLWRVGAMTRPELKTNPRVTSGTEAGRPGPSGPRIGNRGILRTCGTDQRAWAGIGVDHRQRSGRHVPEAVVAIHKSIDGSNGFPSLDGSRHPLQLRRYTSRWDAEGKPPGAGRRVGLAVLRPRGAVRNDERNLWVRVQAVKEKKQVGLVNEEAE